MVARNQVSDRDIDNTIYRVRFLPDRGLNTRFDHQTSNYYGRTVFQSCSVELLCGY